MKKSDSLAVLILAAGTSSRLGEPKQLVQFQSKSLLWLACSKALKLSSDVFVVLGEKCNECQKEIEDLDLNIILNEEYKEGLASSIRAGISQLGTYDKVLIILCDQPFIPLSHYKEIVQESTSENKIICSSYHNKLAVPALFPNKHFAQLLQLQGDRGAKKIIEQNEYKYITLEDNLAFDIDTKADVDKLKKGHKC